MCADLTRGEKNLRAKGPVWMPTKTLRLTVRKLPVGRVLRRGWLHAKIHKRLADLHSPSEIVKQITFISTESGVKAEVTNAGA